MSDLQFQPFANGSEYDYWTARNCERCPISYATTEREICSIDTAIGLAAAGDGTIPMSIALRGGWNVATHAMGPCPEREYANLEAATAPKPADQVMRELGAPTLPGMGQ